MYIYIYIYMKFDLKIGSFCFARVIGYKNEDEAIKDLTFFLIKSDNSKNIYRNFSGAVVGSVGSVQFQIVPCASFYLFSRSIAPSNVVSADYRVLICFTSHFQSGSLSYVYFGSLFVSLFSV